MISYPVNERDCLALSRRKGCLGEIVLTAWPISLFHRVVDLNRIIITRSNNMGLGTSVSKRLSHIERCRWEDSSALNHGTEKDIFDGFALSCRNEESIHSRQALLCYTTTQGARVPLITTDLGRPTWHGKPINKNKAVIMHILWMQALKAKLPKAPRICSLGKDATTSPIIFSASFSNLL